MASVTGGAGLEAAMQGIADRIAKAKEVRVGFLAHSTYPDGTPVAMVAAIDNFGAPAAGIPARPFFTNMVADKSGTWSEQFGQVLKANDYDADKALELMGEGIADQLRQSIIDTDGPPNSPVTNLLKQRFPMGGQSFDDVMQARHDVANGATAPAGKPLVWSGVMINSIGRDVS
jgi:hypothetical protein